MHEAVRERGTHTVVTLSSSFIVSLSLSLSLSLSIYLHLSLLSPTTAATRLIVSHIESTYRHEPRPECNRVTIDALGIRINLVPATHTHTQKKKKKKKLDNECSQAMERMGAP